MENWFQKRWKKILIVLVCGFGVYLFLKYLLRYTAPFIIAWIIASLLEPIVRCLDKKLKMQRGIATLLSMITVLSGIGWVISIIVRKISIQVTQFYHAFPIYRDQILNTLNKLADKTQYLFKALPPGSKISFEQAVDQSLQNIARFLGSFVSKGSINIVSKVPNVLFFTIVTLLSVFFMSRDYVKIKRFVWSQLPEGVSEKTNLMKQDLRNALWGYVRTQLILMCFTMAICIVGLLLLRINYALLIGITISILDALPVFGSGAILIPWALYNVLLGQYSMSLGLVAIYALIIVIRQTMEPKVLSSQIGVYALVTLMAMYIGFKALGVIGLIVGPIVVIMLQTLQRIGVLPPFKEVKNK